jgi:hypothetical protein
MFRNILHVSLILKKRNKKHNPSINSKEVSRKIVDILKSCFGLMEAFINWENAQLNTLCK